MENLVSVNNTQIRFKLIEINNDLKIEILT